MFSQILRIVIGGILAGVVLFAIPFLLFKAVFFFLFVGLLFRIFGRRRYGYRSWRHYDPHFGRYEQRPFEGREGLRDPFYQNPKNI